MSVWKKAGKAHQKTHKERHQPEERKHLGLLEKKKDYVQRANDFSTKKQTLKLLRKRALNKNPDEFYFHMINAKTEDGRHFDKEKEEEDTPDQLKLMRTQDLKYIVFKRTQEMRKIEKLQAQMHLSSVNHGISNKHIVFPKNLEEDISSVKKKSKAILSKQELPDVDVNRLIEISKKRKSVYQELSKRIKREKELSVIQQKLEINRILESKKFTLPPKRVKKGTKNSAPVYEFKFERKR